MSKLVSVVIPVYNCGKYISECLDSVTCQTYKNIEIIIVNNNSTDGSRIICEDYQRQFPKISLTDNPQKGLAPTRLAGMALAKGDWLLHLDADDKFVLDMIEKMVAVAEYNNADITICDFFKWTPNKITVMKHNYNGLFDRKKIKAEIAPNIIPGS